MIKWLLVVVVVLNLLVAMYGSFQQRPPMDIRAQEVSASQVKLLPAGGWAPVASDAVAAKQAASAPQAVHQVASAPQAAKSVASANVVQASKVVAKAEASRAEPAKPDAAKSESACYQWGALTPSLHTRVKGGLNTLRLKSGQLTETASEEVRGSGKFWVYYPPLNTVAETQTLSSELKGKGFDNYIVRNDEFKGNLSLGLYSREEAAKSLAAKVKAAGFDKVMIQSKGQKTSLTTLSFKDLDPQQSSKLKALQQRLTPGILLKACN